MTRVPLLSSFVWCDFDYEFGLGPETHYFLQFPHKIGGTGIACTSLSQILYSIQNKHWLEATKMSLPQLSVARRGIFLPQPDQGIKG